MEMGNTILEFETIDTLEERIRLNKISIDYILHKGFMNSVQLKSLRNLNKEIKKANEEISKLRGKNE
jgi:hypothetical protein